MKPSRGVWAVNAGCFLVLVWLYGLSIWDWLRARDAEVAALAELPRLWFDVPVLLLACAGLGAVIYGAVRKKDRAFRGYRLLPILLVVALFVDAFLLSQAKFPVSSADQSAVALHILSARLEPLTTPQAVPDDAAAIDKVVGEMGTPPFLVRGRKLDRFNVQVRKGCEGPILDAPGTAPATFLYCVAKDRSVAWITLVSLPAEQRFGSPQVFSRGGEVQMVTVERAPPEEEGADPMEEAR